MSDRETLDVYARRAGDYADAFEKPSPDRHLEAYIAALPTGARVLDLGCGPGRAAAAMRDAGLLVDASDASPEMAAIARDRFDLKVRVADFFALDAVDRYDGIYANFSLLHAPKSDMPGHLARIATALKPGGLFHVGLKTGTGETRDELGRFYAYYTDDEITGLLESAGFQVESRHTGSEAGLDGVEAPFIILKAKLHD
ncbi:MAG: methyltransferase domain-containing protein [Silicimonas sp.]|nr:methyltransferase domain-containing protein [Silicimonas sp.]